MTDERIDGSGEQAASDQGSGQSYARVTAIAQWTGLALGPVLAIVAYLLTADAPGLTADARRVIALAVLMATWWLTEALPVSVTALLPVALLPLLGISNIKQACAPYADDILFLFMGGFIIGEAIRASGLHRRVALMTILAVGTTPGRMVGGVMLATVLLSMWVSNTATTLMMLPIGVSIVALVETRSRQVVSGARGNDEWTPAAVSHFGIAIVLGIAYAASIGGMATPVGTPPNLIMLNFSENSLGRTVGFREWMMIGVPLVAVLLPIAWLLLTRVLHPVRAGEVPGGRELIVGELQRLGRLSRTEWVTLVVFICTAAAWIGRERLARATGLTRLRSDGRPETLLTDAGIAIIAAIVLFLIPIRLRPREAVVKWREAERLPWGILLLFGGGLSLAKAMETTGVDKYLGSLFGGLEGMPMLLMLLVLVASVTIIGELASNAAVVTALMPVLAAAAPAMGLDPIPLMLAATLGSSCGYMLPVATPPNALAFATGRVTQPQMIRAGASLDVIGIVIVSVAVYFGASLISRAGNGGPAAEASPAAPVPSR